MKVGFIIHPQQEVSLPFDADGSTPNLTYRNARRLVELGHEVIIYARRAEGQKPVEYDGVGVQIRRLPPTGEEWLLKPFNLLERIIPIGNPKKPLFASSLYFVGFALRVARDLKRQAADVVHINNFSQFAPVIHSVYADVRVVLHMHCEWLTLLDRQMIGDRLQHVDLVIGCSEYITASIQERFPEVAARCRTVPNGVDIAHFGPPSSGEGTRTAAPRLLYVGRISPEKGVHVLVDAFNEIAPQHADVRLEIVGSARLLAYTYLVGLSGEDEVVSRLTRFYGETFWERLQRLLVTRDTSYLGDLQGRLTAGAAPRVTFRGPVPHSRLPELYRQAEVVVLPSVCNEAFGMSLIEAMACGRATVGTRIGGIPNVIVEGETGLLVPRNDADALAEAVVYLLLRSGERTGMGREGRDRAVAAFSWEHVTERLLTAYAEHGLIAEDAAARYGSTGVS